VVIVVVAEDSNSLSDIHLLRDFKSKGKNKSVDTKETRINETVAMMPKAGLRIEKKVEEIVCSL
jgi:hypothetical protein